MHGTYKRIGAGLARRWAWKALLGTALTPLLLVGGCETNAGTGMLAGGAIGALAGGAIGAVTHHPEAGALIGAAAGATGGGLVGAAVDNHQEKVAVQAAAQRRAMGLQDVVTLTRQGTSDDIIINNVRTSGTIFRLSGDEIVWLKQNQRSRLRDRGDAGDGGRAAGGLYAPAAGAGGGVRGTAAAAGRRRGHYPRRTAVVRSQGDATGGRSSPPGLRLGTSDGF